MLLHPFDPNEAFHFSELKKLGYEDLIDKLNKREGAYLLLEELPKRLPCSQDDLQLAGSRRSTVGDYFRPWELCGMVYHEVLNRQHEALAVFRGLYEHMLRRQVALNVGIHKAMPLVWMEECHALLGHPVLAKRYMMLTAIEDAIRHGGRVPPDEGVYFRLVWRFGMHPDELLRYSHEAARIEQEHPVDSRYPE
jgi:hypothetical protein